MPTKQILDGVKCVQFDLAVGNKQRRCLYCGHVVKKKIGVQHVCKSRISKLMDRYVMLSFNEKIDKKV